MSTEVGEAAGPEETENSPAHYVGFFSEEPANLSHY